MLVTLYKIDGVHFRLLGANGFHIKANRGKNENVCQMSKNEKCTCKACKTNVFHCKICKFVTFLLQSSSWLRKVANESINFIDLIHKWRLINYSFIFMPIILTSLILKEKFF